MGILVNPHHLPRLLGFLPLEGCSENTELCLMSLEDISSAVLQLYYYCYYCFTYDLQIRLWERLRSLLDINSFP